MAAVKDDEMLKVERVQKGQLNTILSRHGTVQLVLLVDLAIPGMQLDYIFSHSDVFYEWTTMVICGRSRTFVNGGHIKMALHTCNPAGLKYHQGEQVVYMYLGGQYRLGLQLLSNIHATCSHFYIMPIVLLCCRY